MTTQSHVDAESYRLPKTVVPDHYAITIEPDLTRSRFDGRETIRIRVTEPVNEIILNAADMELTDVSLVDAAGRRTGATVELDGENERAVLRLQQSVASGEYDLDLKFGAELSTKLHGLYRSAYRDADGREQVLAATQFEPTDARRAFPCWDEPDVKATYQLTLVIDSGLTAVANTRVVEEHSEADGAKKRLVFAPTIRMSTYLVAFVVGKLESTEPVMVGEVPLRVVCVPGKRHLADFALRAGAFSLDFFVRYYGIPYPGDKLDLIAIPDFASGAMENLGAITFRETALLVHEPSAARSDLERIADVVAHEIAHMWFGDLVTMRWWNGLWLNEAFATFMEMLAVDAWKPAWDRWTSFGVSRAAALVTDGLESTRPIEYPVRHPREAEGMFDVLTYEKGGAVLRMLEQYVGPETFQRGISRYLNEHAYDNAETTDLWDAIEAASGEPVRRLMDSWIFQGGYPLVSVESAQAGLRLRQERFRYLGGGSGDARWHVPVLLRSGIGDRSSTHRLLLSEGEANGPASGSAPVVVNAGGHGFYRVRYERELLDRLVVDLQHTMTPIERFNLISDTWACCVAGLSPVADVLTLLDRLGEENDRNVWRAVIDVLTYLNRVLDQERWPVFQDYVRTLLRPALERTGWDSRPDESEQTSQLRAMLVRSLATLGEDPEVQSEANSRYRRYLEDRAAAEPNLVPALIAIAAHTGDPSEYEAFIERYRAAQTPQEEQRYLFGRAEFQQPELLQRTLDDALTDAIRTQDAPYLVAAVMMNHAASDLAWQFIKQNWETINRRFPGNTIPRMCGAITALVRSDLEADLRDFFATHPLPQAGKMIDQYLERLHIAVQFREREAAALAAAFPTSQG